MRQKIVQERFGANATKTGGALVAAHANENAETRAAKSHCSQDNAGVVVAADKQAAAATASERSSPCKLLRREGGSDEVESKGSDDATESDSDHVPSGLDPQPQQQMRTLFDPVRVQQRQHPQQHSSQPGYGTKRKDRSSEVSHIPI